MLIEKNTTAFAEYILLNALCRTGSDEDVLRQYLRWGYDKKNISSRFHLCYNNISSLPHPFITACENGNLPVVKLFLILGVNPRDYLIEHHKRAVDVFKDNVELYQILSEDIRQEERQYPERLAMIMNGKLEESIQRGSFVSILIYGMQGLRITDYSCIYSSNFQKLPDLQQAFVYRMVMSPQQRETIAQKIEKVCGKQCIPPVLQRTLGDASNDCNEKIQKIIHSAELLPESAICNLISSMFSEEEQISLLRQIIESQVALKENKALRTFKTTLFEKLYDSIYNP